MRSVSYLVLRGFPIPLMSQIVIRQIIMRDVIVAGNFRCVLK